MTTQEELVSKILMLVCKFHTCEHPEWEWELSEAIIKVLPPQVKTLGEEEILEKLDTAYHQGRISAKFDDKDLRRIASVLANQIPVKPQIILHDWMMKKEEKEDKVRKCICGNEVIYSERLQDTACKCYEAGYRDGSAKEPKQEPDNKKICRSCNGLGGIFKNTLGECYSYDCPHCKGTGYLDVIRDCKDKVQKAIDEIPASKLYKQEPSKEYCTCYSAQRVDNGRGLCLHCDKLIKPTPKPKERMELLVNNVEREYADTDEIWGILEVMAKEIDRINQMEESK